MAISAGRSASDERSGGSRRGVRQTRTISANLRLTDESLDRLLALTGSSTDFILSSADGKATVRVGLEVSSVPAAQLVIGSRRVTLDWSRATIARSGNRVTLSHLELRLLAALAEAAPKAATKRQLIRRLWPAQRRKRSEGEMGLAVAICSLRKRFDVIGVPDAIRTIRKVGYRLGV